MIPILFFAFLQGVSEFLPISSSAHLIIFRDILLVGKNIISSDLELSFDIALHFGTLLAVLVYFHKDFTNMIINKNSNTLIKIIIATIPAAFVGFIFDDFIESFVRTKYLFIIIIFIVMGFIIYYSDKKSKQEKSIDTMSIKDSLIIGFCQVFALIPGVSRSGMTITASRLLKINRQDSTKFSFYLSAPIIMGAFIIQLFKIDYNIIINYLHYFIIGVLVSFITGIVCIKMLLKYVKNNNFKIFMIYRLLLGIIVLLHILR